MDERHRRVLEELDRALLHDANAGTSRGRGSDLTLDERTAHLYDKLPLAALSMQEGSTMTGISLPPNTTAATMLNALLLREGSQPLSDRLRAKVLILDNARSQEEAQKHEARRRAQVVRKRRRLSGSSLPEEKGRRPGPDSTATATTPGDYNSYLPLHEQWRHYFTSVLQGVSESSSSDSSHSYHTQLQKRVMCSDLHGCLLKVVDSKCRSDINIQGIVVRESTRTFHLITPKDDKIRIIPKAGHVFGMEVEGEGGKVVTVRLYGNGLVDRMKALEVMAGSVKKDKKHRNEGQQKGSGAGSGPGRIATTAL